MNEQIVNLTITLPGAITIVALFLLAASIACGFATKRFTRKIDGYARSRFDWKSILQCRDFFLKHADRVNHWKSGTAAKKLREVKNAK